MERRVFPETEDPLEKLVERSYYTAKNRQAWTEQDHQALELTAVAVRSAMARLLQQVQRHQARPPISRRGLIRLRARRR